MEFGGQVQVKSTVSNNPTKLRVGRQSYLGNIKINGEIEETLYNNPLSFYDVPPPETLSLDLFEKYALARLKMLRVIERHNLTSNVKFSKDWFDAIRMDIRNDIPEFYSLLFFEGAEAITSRKFDHISHFLLRLAFARTEEQRRWFISLELDLFKMKLKCHGLDEKNAFIQSIGMPASKVSAELLEDTKFKEDLKSVLSCTQTVGSPNVQPEDVYEVPFTLALDLVARRKCYLRNGFAYIAPQDLDAVICMVYRGYLSECLSMIKKNMHLVEQDGRIMQLIQDFDRRHTGADYVSKNGDSSAVTVEQLETFSQKSFPLCMKSLYDVVKKEHHLKHFGRLQLGLFFKGLGVPLEEATKFWRSHFTRRPEIDGNRFDKQYLYNIRHMYGKEGKRADYTPYSCMKVITSSVGPGEHHGCPFKHSDDIRLRQKLTDAQVTSKGIKEILELVEKHHFQIACTKYFEYTHAGATVEGGVNHPNQYFEESRDTLSGKKTLKAEDKLKTTRRVVYPDGKTNFKEEPMHPDTIEDVLNDDDDNPTEMDEEETDTIFGNMAMPQSNES